MRGITAAFISSYVKVCVVDVSAPVPREPYILMTSAPLSTWVLIAPSNCAMSVIWPRIQPGVGGAAGAAPRPPAPAAPPRPAAFAAGGRGFDIPYPDTNIRGPTTSPRLMRSRIMMST